MENEKKGKTVAIQAGESFAPVAMLFLRPWIFNKAILALIAVGVTLPIFTYWQMFFILWALISIVNMVRRIFHK